MPTITENPFKFLQEKTTKRRHYVNKHWAFITCLRYYPLHLTDICNEIHLSAFTRLKITRSLQPSTNFSMGIPGLTSFVHSTENLWTTIDLRDTKLVIDGLALNCCLYENSGLDCRCGGQYDEFYQAVVAFFSALKSRRVDCFVVFDGTIDPSGKKLETIKKRAEQGLETVHELSTSGDIDDLISFPLLYTHVFKQALRDKSIPFAICDR